MNCLYHVLVCNNTVMSDTILVIVILHCLTAHSIDVTHSYIYTWLHISFDLLHSTMLVCKEWWHK